MEMLPNMSKEIGAKLEAQQAMDQALAVVAKEKNLGLIAKNPERPRLIGPCLERVFWVKESDRFPGAYDRKVEPRSLGHQIAALPPPAREAQHHDHAEGTPDEGRGVGALFQCLRSLVASGLDK